MLPCLSWGWVQRWPEVGAEWLGKQANPVGKRMLVNGRYGLKRSASFRGRAWLFSPTCADGRASGQDTGSSMGAGGLGRPGAGLFGHAVG